MIGCFHLVRNARVATHRVDRRQALQIRKRIIPFWVATLLKSEAIGTLAAHFGEHSLAAFFDAVILIDRVLLAGLGVFFVWQDAQPFGQCTWALDSHEVPGWVHDCRVVQHLVDVVAEGVFSDSLQLSGGLPTVVSPGFPVAVSTRARKNIPIQPSVLRVIVNHKDLIAKLRNEPGISQL